MIRITFINGSHYCESGKTKLQLKRDSWDRNSYIRRLNRDQVVTFLKIFEDTWGKWINVVTEKHQFYNIKPKDLIYLKEHQLR